MKRTWKTTLCIMLALAAAISAQKAAAATDGLEQDGLRVRFLGDDQTGYKIVFQQEVDGQWQAAASLPDGRTWTVYAAWSQGWYADPHHVVVQKIETFDDGRVKASAETHIAGQPWRFVDIYSIENGLIKIDRTFEHLGDDAQSEITLATRVRLVLGEDPRMLIPGSIYHGNPSSTLPGPRLSYEPGTVGLYEEHRLPIPMANIESTVDGRRLHGTLVTLPGKIDQGHKGDDHWWSLGLEYGEGFVDLLSVSGPVATNGKKSTIYGHRNGFDPYDEAYLDVAGPKRFEKTLYLDLGVGLKKGHSYRRAMWKAFDIFHPIDVPHIPFAEAMALKTQYAKGTFFRDAPDVAGFCAWPWPNRHFQYGWCGGNISIAYGLLSHAGRTDDRQALRQAVDTIDFFTNHCEQDVKGMLYGDYFAAPALTSPYGVYAKGNGWQPTQFHGAEPAISSRQLGETLERLAEAITLARKLKLDRQADRWQATLRKGCDFLMRSPRHQAMFPRAWNTDGTARGWDGNRPEDPGWLSTAGAYCVGPLVRMGRFSGEKKYVELAEEVLAGYWKQFGEDQSTPPWGGTHDAGAEDKEAGWGLMKAALDVYETTKDPKHLEWAQLAADWTMTWMYFHNVGMPQSDLLREQMNTIGWTFISTQNQEIDVFGFWMAPDYYRLGQLLDDERYKQVGKILFDASTQTIARPGAMFGQAAPGIQGEHYNHSNCTYVPNGPWRGSQHSIGIGWVLASTLYGGTKLAELDPDRFPYAEATDPRIVVPTARRQRNVWRHTFQQPAKDWYRADFDDSTWPEAPGGFGEYGTPGSVIATWWDAKHKRIWIRRTFELGRQLPKQPRLAVHHDDAAEIYINGVLAARLAGYQSAYRLIPLSTEAIATLKPGRNVLAATCQDETGGRYIDVGLVDAADRP